MSIALGAGREFDAVRSLIARWGENAAGIGDDAAVLEVPRGESLVVSVDASFERRHFRRGWLTPSEIGYRAVAAAMSDLAAMAAHPLGILVALALPEKWRDELVELADGIGEAARACGAKVLGGNTAAAGELSITTTVLGSAFRPLRRDALAAGDSLYVTGALGASGAAMRALAAGVEPTAANRERFARPRPRIHEARWLAAAGAHAAIDISDGLAADLGHLAAASDVTVEVELEMVPVVAGVSMEDAVASGEEYELVIGTSRELDTGAFAAAFGLPLTWIGRVRAGRPEVILTRNGARVANPAGYDHLST